MARRSSSVEMPIFRKQSSVNLRKQSMVEFRKQSSVDPRKHSMVDPRKHSMGNIRKFTTQLSHTKLKSIQEDAGRKKSMRQIIDVEKQQTGSIKWSVYLIYLKANGYFFTFLVFLFYAIANGFQVSANIWLADWSNDATKLSKNATVPNTSERLAGYAGLGIGQGNAHYGLVAI